MDHESKPKTKDTRRSKKSLSEPERPVAGEVRLDSVLAVLLRSSGIRKNGPVTIISERWSDVVGADVASHSLVKGYSRGVLGIEVDSAPWLQELSSFRKQEILDRLTEVVPEARVRDLKFSIRG